MADATVAATVTRLLLPGCPRTGGSYHVYSSVAGRGLRTVARWRRGPDWTQFAYVRLILRLLRIWFDAHDRFCGTRTVPCRCASACLLPGPGSQPHQLAPALPAYRTPRRWFVGCGLDTITFGSATYARFAG